jgi:hypothetical protein
VANILHIKLETFVTEALEYQGGIRRRSTVDYIFTVKQTLERCWEQNLFIDFQAALTQHGGSKCGLK